MHVCAIASARATIGGPLRNDLLKRTSARVAAFQSLTTVARAEVAQRSAGTSATTVITQGSHRSLPSSFGTLRHRMLRPARLIVKSARRQATPAWGRAPRRCRTSGELDVVQYGV